VIITDTVGFIRDLPKELMVAFQATLEELESADILLHVIDISNPRFKEQVESVGAILADLHLTDIPLIHVLNKQDLVDDETVGNLKRRYQGVAVSAVHRKSLLPLIDRLSGLVTQLETANGSQEIGSGPNMMGGSDP